MIDDSFLQEIKFKINIEDVISEYVKLKRYGKNYKGLCPFHNEKTPSFSVNAEKGFFHCFGCGVGGDVITFIMKIENLDYISAVKFLAEKVGMTVPNDSFDDTQAKLRLRILEANRATAKYFHSNLVSNDGKKGLLYFKNRQLSIKTITRFGLGYCKPSRFDLSNHLKSLGFTDDEIVSANLGYLNNDKKLIDRFYDRVMFPIIDLRGNVLGFGGRQLEDFGPKYINTSDTLVFKKSYNIFSLNFAKNTKDEFFILAEGYMDVIALFQAGFTNAVATLGTALTSQQAKVLARHKNQVIISYDSDSAGQKATNRAIPILRDAGLKVKVVDMGNQKDPDEYIKHYGIHGAEKYKNLLLNSKSDVDFKLYNLKSKFNLDINENRVEYLTQACLILKNLDNSIERDVYSSKLANELNVNKQSILTQIEKLENRNTTSYIKKSKNSAYASQKLDVLNQKNNIKSFNAEKALILYLINSEDIDKTIFSTISVDAFSNAFFKKIYSKIFEKHNNNRLFGFSDICAELNDNEISILTDLMSHYPFSHDTIDSAKKYVDIINLEYSKRQALNAEDLDNNKMSAYIEQLRNERK